MDETQQPVNDLPAEPTPATPALIVDEASNTPPEVQAAIAEVAAGEPVAVPTDEAVQKAIDEAGEPAPAERPVFKRIGAQSWVEEVDQVSGDLVRRYPQGEGQ